MDVDLDGLKGKYDRKYEAIDKLSEAICCLELERERVLFRVEAEKLDFEIKKLNCLLKEIL